MFLQEMSEFRQPWELLEISQHVVFFLLYRPKTFLISNITRLLFTCLWPLGEQLATELGCSYLEVAAAEQVQPTCAVFHEVCREVLALRRRGKQSLLDRMLASAKSSSKTASGGAGPRTYLRGKSDSALPWASNRHYLWFLSSRLSAFSLFVTWCAKPRSLTELCANFWAPKWSNTWWPDVWANLLNLWNACFF